MTGTEVARQLRISRSKVYVRMRRRVIPTVRMGRNVRVRQLDIDENIRIMVNRFDPIRH